jgi:hypothetical protein
LAPFPGAVRADVLDGTWSPPVSDGSGRDRTILRRALALFAAAGYELRGTELVERRPNARARGRPQLGGVGIMLLLEVQARLGAGSSKAMAEI